MVSKFKKKKKTPDSKYRFHKSFITQLTGIRSCPRTKCRLTRLLPKHRRLAAAWHCPKSRWWWGLGTSRKQWCWRRYGAKAWRVRLAGTLTLSKRWGLVSTKCWTGRWCWMSSAKYKGGSWKRKNKSTTSRFVVRLLLKSSVEPQTNFRPLYRLLPRSQALND